MILTTLSVVILHNYEKQFSETALLILGNCPASQVQMDLEFQDQKLNRKT